MRAELRADGLHLMGYVNVPGRESRPVMTPRGRVLEIIEQRAFERAIERTGRIDLLLDHDPDRILATTEDGTLNLREDNVGLRAETVITDPEVIDAARKKKLRGWSFKMIRPEDSMEERADRPLPVRKISNFLMPEVSLIMKKVPCYSSTSIEIRAGEVEDVEQRAMDDNMDFSEEKKNCEEYRSRLEELKKVKYD